MNRILRKNGENISVKVLAITGNGILISIPEGDFFLPYSDYPWFKNARVDEVLDVKSEGNFAIRWDKLDVDLEIDSILHPEKYPIIMNNL
ncbi:MAG: DUF2442 domain-containing protein [Flavobacteriaceae bacterium]|jgi:hypothetical protein|nr:DUF2442 domain-containing protein [Flavobacteriaceae bacterium]